MIDALQPNKFDTVVMATKTLCVESREPGDRPSFKTPSTALKIGYGIRRIVSIERGKALKKGDLRKSEEMLSFLSVFDIEWSTRVSSSALSTLSLRKMNSVDLLPISEDLVKLNKFIEDIDLKALSICRLGQL